MAEISNAELSTLLSLTDTQKRDAWAASGSVTLPPTIRNFSKNLIFVLDSPGDPLDQYTLFTIEEIAETSDIPWADYTVNDATDGTIIRDTIIHPYIYAIQTGADRGAVATPVDLTYNPFEDSYAITISDDELDRILVDVGFPFLTFDDLEFTKKQVLNLMIRPAMEEFFKWFPKIRTESYQVVQNRFDFPVPSYAVKPVRAWITPGYPGSSIGNPIMYYFDEVLLAVNARGSFMQPQNNFMAPQKFVDIFGHTTYLLDRAVRQGIANQSSRVRIRLQHDADDNSLHVTGFSSKLGLLHVDWAIMSNLWSDIPFNRQTEVRDLARAKVMKALGMLRSQVRSEAIGTIDPTVFLTEADKLETKVIELWKSFPKAVIIRGT